MRILGPRRLYKIAGYVKDYPLFLFERDEDYLERFLESEWTEYELWLYRNRRFSLDKLYKMYKETRSFRLKPKISIIMPLYNPVPSEFYDALQSVLWQAYPHWELCLVDDASLNKEYLKLLGRIKDRRIKLVEKDKNTGIADTSQTALEMATGDFVALMDQDDELTPDALYAFVKVLQERDIDYFYSDRDMISPGGKRYMHFFKPGWSPEYLLSTPYVTHLEIFNRELLKSIGGFRKAFTGSQDYDLVLRVTEKTDKIYHYPMVFYNWRQSLRSVATAPETKLYAYEAAVRALNDTIKRRKLPATNVIELEGMWRGNYKIIWDQRALADKKVYIMVIGGKSASIDVLRTKFKDLLEGYECTFIQTNDNQSEIRKNLNSLPHDSYVFFCDCSVIEPVSGKLTDMIGYLSIEGVGVVGCKFVDEKNQIVSVGITVARSGKVLFSYRKSTINEIGYGGICQIARNVSLTYPSFWGCNVKELRQHEFPQKGTGFFEGSLYFFLDILKQKKRIVCSPFVCMRVNTDGISIENIKKDIARIWLKYGMQDRYYNPNLSDINEDYGIKI